MYRYYIFVVSKKTFSDIDLFYIVLDFALQWLGAVLKIFAKFTKSTCAGVSFFSKFQPGGLQHH